MTVNKLIAALNALVAKDASHGELLVCLTRHDEWYRHVGLLEEPQLEGPTSFDSYHGSLHWRQTKPKEFVAFGDPT